MGRIVDGMTASPNQVLSASLIVSGGGLAIRQGNQHLNKFYFWGVSCGKSNSVYEGRRRKRTALWVAHQIQNYDQETVETLKAVSASYRKASYPS